MTANIPRRCVALIGLVAAVCVARTATAQTSPPPRDDSHWIPVIGVDDFYTTNLPAASAVDYSGRMVVAFNVASSPTSSSGFVIVARLDPASSQWDRIGSHLVTGLVNTGVRDIATLPNGDFYVVGNFYEAVNADGGTTPTSGIVRWDANNLEWDNLGGGLDGPAEAIDATPSGDVCVGGHFAFGSNRFTPATELNNVGCWDGNAWYALGGGVEFSGFPAVRELDVDPNGNITVVGSFTTTYDTPNGTGAARNHIARWTGNAWSSLGGGLAQLTFVSVTSDSANVYVAGNPQAQNASGPVVSGAVIRWDGSQWTTFTSGLPATFPLDVVRSGSGTLYLFDARNVYRHRPADTQWESVGTLGPPGFASTIAASPASSEDLYLGGAFSEISPTSGPPVVTEAYARWDGTDWHAAGAPATGMVDDDVFATTVAGAIIVGGRFTQVGLYPASRVALLENASWYELGNGVTAPDSAVVRAIETTSSRWVDLPDFIFVGGYLTEVQNTDGTPVPVSNVAMFDREAGTWHSLGQGVNGEVHALHYRADGLVSGLMLYVGGAFTEATNADGSTVEVGGIARYNFDTHRWEAPGMGVGGGEATVLAIDTGRRFATAPNGSEPFSHDLFVGGSFESALDDAGAPVTGTRNIAWFSAREGIWRGLGQGADSTVRAVRYIRHPIWPTDSAPYTFDRGVLYAGGDFRVVREPSGTIVPANHLAKWTIHDNDWSIIGQNFSSNGMDGPVHSLELHQPTTVARWVTRVGLIIGGRFGAGVGSDGTTVTLNNIALLRDDEPTYDRPAAYVGERFEPFGSGTDDVVFDTGALYCPLTGRGETVYAGGAFSSAGGKSSRALAKWHYNYTIPATRHALVRNSSPCTNCRSAVASGPSVPPLCAGGAAKRTGLDVVLFDDLGFGDEAVPITSVLPIDEPFSVEVSSGTSVLRTVDSVFVESYYPTLFVMTGVLDPQTYAPNPDGRPTELAIRPVVIPEPAATAAPGTIGVSFLNAVTDAPSIDIALQGGSTVVEDVRYGEINLQPIDLQAGAHTLEVRRHSDGQVLGTYQATLSDLQTVIVLEGFADPAANQNGPPMDLAVVDVSTILSLSSEFGEPQSDAAELEPNYPNPFRQTTTIRYRIPTAGPVRLSVYDLLGRRVAVLVDEQQPPGTWSIPFDATGLAAGLYMYELTTATDRQTRSLVVVR